MKKNRIYMFMILIAGIVVIGIIAVTATLSIHKHKEYSDTSQNNGQNNLYASSSEQPHGSEKTTNMSTAHTEQQDFPQEGIKKRQVIYIKTSPSGEQEGVYVVNSFDAEAERIIDDIGDYNKVTNLTDTQGLNTFQGKTSFIVSPGQTFRYQGDLSQNTSTPWNVSVHYKLNGQTVNPTQLSKAQGSVEIDFHIEPNSSYPAQYAQNYLTQITAGLNNNHVRNIDAPNANFAQSGDDTQLSYLVFPGKTGDFSITCDAKDFTFDGFQIVAIPLSLALTVDDKEFDSATAELTELDKAISRLRQGTDRAAKGAQQIGGGLDELVCSGKKLNDGATQLEQAFSELETGSHKIAKALTEQVIPGAQKLAQGSTQYTQGLDKTIASLKQKTHGYSSDQAQKYLQQQLAAFAQNPHDEDVQKQLADAQTLVTTLQVLHALESVRSEYTPLDQGIQGMVDETNPRNLGKLASGAQELSHGVDKTAQGFGELSSGISSYTDGVETLGTHFSELQSGISSLAQGTHKLSKSTAGMDKKLIKTVQDKIKQYLNPQYVAPDFMSGSPNISRVQFVYKTGSIS